MSLSINELKNRISPEYYYSQHLNGVFGKHTGNGWHTWNGLCPFHGDTKPGSFVVNRESGAFKCFSCGTNGGDILSFHMNMYNLSFNATFRQLAEAVQ